MDHGAYHVNAMVHTINVLHVQLHLIHVCYCAPLIDFFAFQHQKRIRTHSPALQRSLVSTIRSWTIF